MFDCDLIIYHWDRDSKIITPPFWIAIFFLAPSQMIEIQGNWSNKSNFHKLIKRQLN